MGSEKKEKKDKKKDKKKKSKRTKHDEEYREKKRLKVEDKSASPESYEKTSLSVNETNKLREKLGLKPLDEPSKKEERNDANEISLSIEETNKLRESLGLRPLDVSTKSDGDVHVPAKNLGRIAESEKLAEKMKTLQEKRRIKQQLNRVKSLGNNSVDLTDTVAWVDRSRKIEAKKVLAEARTKMLDSMDDEFGVGELIENEKSVFKPRYTSNDLKDLTVMHDIDSFKEGEMTVLTLKDKEILAEEDEDVLENVNIAENERTSKNVELRKKKADYNPYVDDYDDDGNFKPQNMLSKYDEVIEGEKKKNFKLADTVNPEVIRKKLAEGLPLSNNATVSLDFSKLKKTASEYYSAEEVAAFKKPRKRKKKLRKTTVDDIVPLPSENASTSSKDHGSRASRSKITKDEKPPRHETEENMEIDIDEEPIKNSKSINKGKVSERELYSVRLEDDDDSELQAALSRARRSNLIKERKAMTIAETVATMAPSSESLPGASKTSTIVLDTTEEFAKNIGNEEEEEEVEVEDDVMDIDKKTSEWKDVDLITAQFGEFQDYDPDVQQEVIEAEPLLQRGLSGALQVAQRKGFIEEQKKMAGAVDINDAVKPTGKLKARFFQLDRDTGQDMDSRRRSDRDYSSFPEKKEYNPDVKIVYTDNMGRELDSKEAFRQLSHKFHGKGSGKMKTEKRMKKMLEQLALKKMDSDDTPLGSAALLREKQKEANASYIVLSGGNRIPTDVHNTLSKISKR